MLVLVHPSPIRRAIQVIPDVLPVHPDDPSAGHSVQVDPAVKGWVDPDVLSSETLDVGGHVDRGSGSRVGGERDEGDSMGRSEKVVTVG